MAWDDDELDPEDEEEPDELDGAARTALTFAAGGLLFGLEIGRVAEIAALPERTALPKAPPWLLGVAPWRGRIVPLVDLAARLGLGAPAGALHPCMVVTEGLAFPLALVLDEVREVVPLPPEGAAPPPPGSPPFLAGLARSGERVLLLLEPEGLLGRTERTWVAAALTEAVRALEERAIEGRTEEPLPRTGIPAAPHATRDEHDERSGSGAHAR